MPLEPSYRKHLDSMIADMKNWSAKPGGGITAALFLQEFISTDKARYCVRHLFHVIQPQADTQWPRRQLYRYCGYDAGSMGAHRCGRAYLGRQSRRRNRLGRRIIDVLGDIIFQTGTYRGSTRVQTDYIARVWLQSVFHSLLGIAKDTASREMKRRLQQTR